jgi:hypothetical protein
MTIIQKISIPDSLYEEASNLAQEIQISPSDLFSLAIEDYLHRHHSQKLLQSINDAYADGLDENKQAMLKGMWQQQRHLVETNDSPMIHQGDIYWIDPGQQIGSEPAYIHPYIVIQNDVLNRSHIRTVIVCALTINL